MTQRSLHAVTKVYYGSYAKLCQGNTQYHSNAKVFQGSRGTMTPLALCEPGRVTMPISHSYEQGTLSTTSLISKQAVPYRTHGDTCCPGVSTPKTRSLADLSIINHKPWRSQPSPPFQTMLKPQHRISPLSPHITTDGRPTLLTLNISQTQYHKDKKTCTTLKTVGLSSTINHKNPILKYEGLGNQLMHAACVY
jgi:hypothetical protein